jgi:hypothetical protein
MRYYCNYLLPECGFPEGTGAGAYWLPINENSV